LTLLRAGIKVIHFVFQIDIVGLNFKDLVRREFPDLENFQFRCYRYSSTRSSQDVTAAGPGSCKPGEFRLFLLLEVFICRRFLGVG
jgi:hypothetical protein